jgi:hypothetical protein
MKRFCLPCLLLFFVFNSASQKVGINNTSPQVSLDVKGALALRPEVSIQVTLPITTFNVANVSYLKFSSNNDDATQRLVNLSPGKGGQQLIMEFSGAGAARMINGSGLSNGGRLLLSANMDFDHPSLLGLVSDGTNWRELYRRETLRSETDADSLVFISPGQYSFIGPPGITKIQVLLTGAGGWGGGSASDPIGKGGNGGNVSGDLVVTQGETLDIIVGGGGQGGIKAGITAIKRSATYLALAGAGGNGSNNGGFGGTAGPSGTDGSLGTSIFSLGGPGRGGTPIAGGAGGVAGTQGSSGGNGYALNGGQNDTGLAGDGWGGNGWFGGGAAGTYNFQFSQFGPYASGGGGGGSNFTGGLSGTIVSGGNGSTGGSGTAGGTGGKVKIKW